VVALTLTGGPLRLLTPILSARRADRAGTTQRAADILKVRLDCWKLQRRQTWNRFPLLRTACELSGQRYQEVTELMLDKYRPDIVFYPLALSTSTWIIAARYAAVPTTGLGCAGGKRVSALLHGSGVGSTNRTQNFIPTSSYGGHHITWRQRSDESWKALHALVRGRPSGLCMDSMRRMRGGGNAVGR
jgi:hypothetical protein